MSKIVNEIFDEAKNELFREIAKIISEKRRPRSYLKVLKLVAFKGVIGPKDIVEADITKTKTQAYRYLSYLVKFGILRKSDGEYYIPDPMIRRVSTLENFEEDVLKRLET